MNLFKLKTATVMKNVKSSIRLQVFLLSLFFLCLFVSCQNDSSKSEKANSLVELSGADSDSTMPKENFIKSPCNGADIPYESFSLTSEIGGELSYSSGSKLIVKPNSFVDENGNPVNGEIVVLYREFHNPVDFFVSGIPMNYDTLNEKKYFESAGMIDVLAFKEGKPVFLNPGKKLNVELQSQYDGTDYNVYFLDTVSKKWNYIGKDKVISEPLKALKTEKKEVVVSVTQNMAAPRLANKSKHRFNMDVNLNQFPELASYKGIMFEVSDLNTNFNSKLYNVEWDNAILSESNIVGNYNLKLFKEDTSFSFIVYPVFEGVNYEKAMLDFKSKIKFSNEQVQNKKQTSVVATKNSTKPNADLSVFMPENKTVKDIKRAFEINKFGVWNCDKFTDMPHGQNVVGEYADAAGNKLDFISLFFVDKSKNALFDINPSKKWTYNPKSENLLWGVLRDNRVAVFSPPQFRKLKRKEDRCYFSMSASDNVSALKEIKRFIGL